MITIRRALIRAESYVSDPIDLQPGRNSLMGGLPVAVITPENLDIFSAYTIPPADPEAPAWCLLRFLVSADGSNFRELVVSPDAVLVPSVSAPKVGYYTVYAAANGFGPLHIPVDPQLFRGAIAIKLALVDTDGSPIIQGTDREFQVVLL